MLLIMLSLMIAGTALFVAGLSTTNLRAQQLVSTQQSLALAREALLAYATVRPDRAAGNPAALPCPDIDDAGGLVEGVAHTNSCGLQGETVIGRVPWRTLGIDAPRDGSGACLWYVVSGSWKEAGANSAALINPDSNGQLQLWGVESSAVIEGLIPDERPVAMILAPMAAVPGQLRAAAVNRQCSGDFSATNFLDTDTGSGLSNATLSGITDGVDVLAVIAGRADLHNDRVVTISREDLERRITVRNDYDGNMRALGLAVSACVADYGLKNPGGANDLRLPWPAPLGLADYRPDAAYDDLNGTVLSGRLPDAVDDSNLQTGNPVSQVLSICDQGTVTAWSPAMRNLWQHWKDHFYYVLAESFAPDALVPSVCANCLSVNSAGQYAAVVVFANGRLEALAQVRDAPPMDADTRAVIGNYLEGANASGFPYTGGGFDLVSQAGSNTFNDLLFCIDQTLAVSEC
jgi:hypothetical protein